MFAQSFQMDYNNYASNSSNIWDFKKDMQITNGHKKLVTDFCVSYYYNIKVYILPIHKYKASNKLKTKHKDGKYHKMSTYYKK